MDLLARVDLSYKFAELSSSKVVGESPQLQLYFLFRQRCNRRRALQAEETGGVKAQQAWQSPSENLGV